MYEEHIYGLHMGELLGGMHFTWPEVVNKKVLSSKTYKKIFASEMQLL
jgi:hypothetical protein